MAGTTLPVATIASILLWLHMKVIDMVHKVLQEIKQLVALWGESKAWGHWRRAQIPWLGRGGFERRPCSPSTSGTPAASAQLHPKRAASPWRAPGKRRQAGAGTLLSSEVGRTGRSCGGCPGSAGTADPRRGRSGSWLAAHPPPLSIASEYFCSAKGSRRGPLPRLGNTGGSAPASQEKTGKASFSRAGSRVSCSEKLLGVARPGRVSLLAPPPHLAQDCQTTKKSHGQWPLHTAHMTPPRKPQGEAGRGNTSGRFRKPLAHGCAS